jgi:predicted nucleic acid-binding protein
VPADVTLRIIVLQRTHGYHYSEPGRGRHVPRCHETFRAQRHGRLSFTDAAVVTVARRRDARFVATFDRDFRKVEGLAVVPA